MRNFLYTFLIILYAMAAFNPAFAAEDKIIGNIMAENKVTHKVLFVDKFAKKLYVVEIENEKQTVLKEVDILTGEFEGNKVIEGDKKTPEGVYYILSYMSDKEMISRFGKEIAARYGTGAYPLNYPNVVDKIHKKTGHGIWLHGLDPERHKPATEGCVAMENNLLADVERDIYMGMPVVIVDNVTFYSKEEYTAKREEYLSALNSFIDTWTFGTFDKFKAYVHPDYSSYSAKTASQYLSKKKFLMEKYPEKMIAVDNISIFQESNNLVYDFDQFYCAENIITYGNKKIYLKDGKVISEEMKAMSVKPQMSKYVNGFLTEWIDSWQRKDIEKYASFYSTQFKGYSKLQETKQAIFNRAGIIKVTLSDLNWEITGGNNLKITFKQKYESGINTDYGFKTITLKGCPGNFKIMSEDWRKL